MNNEAFNIELFIPTAWARLIVLLFPRVGLLLSKKAWLAKQLEET